MPCRFPGPHPRGKFRGIWSRPTAMEEVEGDLARGVCSGGCLLQGVPAPGGACSRRVPAPGGMPAPGGACSGGMETLRYGYCCGRYASYKNAFLYLRYFRVHLWDYNYLISPQILLYFLAVLPMILRLGDFRITSQVAT